VNGVFLSTLAFFFSAAAGVLYSQTNSNQSALSNPPQPATQPVWVTNGPTVFRQNPPLPQTFDHFIPSSLPQLIWTNFIAHTNGKSTSIWSTRSRPPDWPRRPPLAQWNTNSLLWGMRGLTALSPCWEDEGGPGQCPITALTRRHGYTRGHGMGDEGFTTGRNGKKIWFLAADNSIVTVKVSMMVIRASMGFDGRHDYTIFLFDKDLPASIQPMRVTSEKIAGAKYPARRDPPWICFQTEQNGNVSAGLAPFLLNAAKGGDSGSPDMLPLPGELVFLRGRSTTGPTPEMQADMDELCRRGRLNPAKYQLQWVDLSMFPSY
jgi:hypothetical protein